MSLRRALALSRFRPLRPLFPRLVLPARLRFPAQPHPSTSCSRLSSSLAALSLPPSPSPPAQYTPSPPTYAQLRPYQRDAIEACMDALGRGVRRMGVSSPTGSGKTVIFTHLIPKLLGEEGRHSGQILILVGSIELAHQAIKTIKAAHPWLTCELEQGTNKATGKADITVATYQSLRTDARLAKYDPANFRGVFVDEAHHSAAESYIKLLSYFNSSVGPPSDPLSPSPSLTGPQVPILGFTATFSRHDRLALSAVFEEIVYHMDVWQMSADGWLAPARFTTVKVDLDLGKARIGKTGDYTTGSLGELVNTGEINGVVVRTWLDKAADRKSTLAFCIDLDHVQSLTDAFRAAGVDARSVSSRTKTADRNELVQGFRDGVFPVLVNCEILTEGADVPSVDCVLIARPTKSRNLFIQMVGRGLRLFPGKENCHIIDLVDNLSNCDGLICAPTLFGLGADAKVEGADFKQLKSRGEEYQAEVAAKETGAREVLAKSVEYHDVEDPFGFSKTETVKWRRNMSHLSWVLCGPEHYVLETREHGIYSIEREGLEYLIRLATYIPEELRTNPVTGLVAAYKHTKPRVRGREGTLREAIKSADALFERSIPRNMLSLHYRSASWRRGPPTDKQIKFLERKNVDPSNMNKGQVASYLTALKNGAKRRLAELPKPKAKKDKSNKSGDVKVGPLLPPEPVEGKVKRLDRATDILKERRNALAANGAG